MTRGKVSTNMQMGLMRAEVDLADEGWIRVLGERFDATRRIGEYKVKEGLPLVDEDREERKIETARRLAEEVEVDPDLVEGIIRSVMDRVRVEHQQQASDVAVQPPN